MVWPFTSPKYEHSAAEVNALDREYDYIVVGGGVSGACLASRLSENPNVNVLVIERGRVNDSWMSRIPLASSNYYPAGAPSAVWAIGPLKRAKDRVVHAVIGEGLGGGSRINACIYTRGSGDYNQWEEMGRKGWGFQDLLPYFMKSENSVGREKCDYRGTTGPWMNRPMKSPFSVVDHVEAAANQAGIPSISDINAPDAPAVCHTNFDVTVDDHSQRLSMARAFLPTSLVQSRAANLVICAGTIVAKIDFSGDHGRPKAIGVSYKSTDVKADSRTYHARLRPGGEVILSAGAIASPQILLLSGVGPKDHLNELGVNVVKDLPGVGSHLKDHTSAPIHYEVPRKDSFNVLRQKPWVALLALLEYLIWGTGLLSLPPLLIALFVRTSLLTASMDVKRNVAPAELDQRNPANIPDIEIMPMPIRACEGLHNPLDAAPGLFGFLTCLLKPRSFGSVRLHSLDPHARASIDLGTLSDERDWIPLRKGVLLAMHLAELVAQGGYPMKPLSVPRSKSQEHVDEFLLDHVRTVYHYACTCRMAPEDDEYPGVVDDELRVHGVDGLRVADASIFPDIVAAHTMAPTVMVAEKCADMVTRFRSISD